MRNKITTPSEDWKQIERYVHHESQAAFHELVKRYIDLVYITCYREAGDRQMAEDAAQAVFLILARKAQTFKPGLILSSWLFDTSRFVTKNALRERRLRAAREERIAHQMAAQSDSATHSEEIESNLNDALGALSHHERQIILLRYFEGYSLTEVGTTLGVSEDAARMRIARSVEKMRKRMQREGVTITGVALLAMLSTEAVKAAQDSGSRVIEALAKSSAAGSSAGFVLSAHVHQISEGALRSMSILKWKIAALAIGGSLAGAGVIASVVGCALHHTQHSDTKSKAQAIMMAMFVSYSKMDSYSCVADRTSTWSNEKLHGTYAVAKPNNSYFSVAGTNRRFTLVSNGNYTCPEWSDSQSGVNFCSKMKYSGADDIAMHWDQFNAPGFSSSPHWLLEATLRGGHWFGAGYKEFTVESPTTIDGVAVDTIYIPSHIPDINAKASMGLGDYLYIGHTDHLLRREVNRMISDPTGDIVEATETYSSIKVNPIIPNAKFAFTPPVGSTQVGAGTINFDPNRFRDKGIIPSNPTPQNGQ